MIATVGDLVAALLEHDQSMPVVHGNVDNEWGWSYGTPELSAQTLRLAFSSERDGDLYEEARPTDTVTRKVLVIEW